MARHPARAPAQAARASAIGHETVRAATAHDNGKCPADLKRDAIAAWARFRSCLEALPASEARVAVGDS